MILALMLGAMTLGAAIALAWPLMHGRPQTPARASFERALYRDQLDEIARDEQRGVIGTEEAAAARAEIERRALAALGRETDRTAKRPSRSGRALAMALVIALPATAGIAYFAIGRPDLPGQPFAARERPPVLSEEERRAGLETMIAMMKERLEAEPRDSQAWNLLARVHRRIGREQETQALYRATMERARDDPARTAEIALAYGEALVNAAEGVVSSEARAAFDEALAADPANVGARFYRGLWLLQSGEPQAALAIWVALAREAPQGAPYLDMLETRIRRVAEEFNLNPEKVGPAPK